MQDEERQFEPESPQQASPDGCSQSTDWYAEGESCVVETGEVRIEIRFVGRKGRKGRIAITAPCGSRFSGRR